MLSADATDTQQFICHLHSVEVSLLIAKFFDMPLCTKKRINLFELHVNLNAGFGVRQCMLNRLFMYGNECFYMQHLVPQSWVMNPFLIHLRRQPPQANRQFYRASLGIAIMWLMLGSVAYHYQLYTLLEFGWWVGWLIYLAVPLILAMASAMLTVQEIQTGHFELISITPLTAKRIVWGFIFFALRRMRLWVALMIGSLPLMLMSAFYKFTEYSFEAAYHNPARVGTLPTANDILGLLLIFSLLLIFFWFCALLGTGLGVSMTLRIQKGGLAAIAALSMMSLNLLILMTPLIIAFSAPTVLRMTLFICAPSDFLLLMPMLWTMVYRLGQYWVRADDDFYTEGLVKFESKRTRTIPVQKLS